MNEYYTLRQYFPDWKTGGGIFAKLDEYNVPWKSADIASYLDFLYFGGQSGGKIASPLCVSLKSKPPFVDDDITILAATLYNLNAKNWEKMFATLSFEYNPIENYSMMETELSTDTNNELTGSTDNTTIGVLKGNTTTHSGGTSETISDTTTHSGGTSETISDTTTHSGGTSETISKNIISSSSAENDVYGFNSATAVPSDESTGSASSSESGTTGTTDTRQESLSGTHSMTDTRKEVLGGTHSTTDTRQEQESGSENTTENKTTSGSKNATITGNRSLSRSGNIGVTTSQQMIEAERKLWLYNFFIDTVFPSIDKFLTLQIY